LNWSKNMSELLKINVNSHVEKKNGLSYLSWAWAWAEVLKIDPGASWVLGKLGDACPAVFFPDGSAMVSVIVTIKGDTKGAVLPVMNHRNQAIKNPDAFAINTAIQRCLAKAIAMHGLGLYIYAGEDLPESDDGGDVETLLKKSIEQAKAAKSGPITGTDGIEEHIPEARRNELDELALMLVENYKAGRESHCADLYYGIEDNDEKVYVWRCLKAESKLRSLIKANSPHTKKVEA
jgi:hypothetical protein